MSELQSEWSGIYDQSGYRLSTLAEMAGIDEGSFRKYLRCNRIPRPTNLEKMVRIMKTATEIERLPFHPSYGYATTEQIERLKSMSVGPDLDLLLKQIEEQTRNRGKFK